MAKMANVLKGGTLEDMPIPSTAKINTIAKTQ
jgi:hypothetical protein